MVSLLSFEFRELGVRRKKYIPECNERFSKMSYPW